MKTEADKLRNSIQYGLGVMDSGSGEFKELSNKIDELFELSYLEGQSNPKIRQLEWEEYRDCLVSTTPFYNVSIKEVCGIYELATAYSAFIKSYNSLDEAKAAAQADFEQRVRECLL